MSKVVKGARRARKKISPPPEEPLHNRLAEAPLTSDSAQQPALVAQSEPLAAEAIPAQNENAEQGEPAAPATRSAHSDWNREISQAGDGAVFPAEDVKATNLFTVELLSQSAASDPEQMKLFHLEAEAAARLQHPQIAHAYASAPFALTHQRRASNQAGPPGAKSLRDLLSYGGWFDPEHALRVITQVADALIYAHEAGVLHLNLQPEHIWLDTADRVLITGFGIVDDGQLEWARQRRMDRCAPPYLSPEQLNGQAGDRASDIYALGVIFYEMLTDRVPFDSIDPNHLRRQHKIKTPRPPQDFNCDLSPELSDAVMGLLNRDPESRIRSFGSGGGFKALLDGFCASVPVQPTPAPLMTNPAPLNEFVADDNTAFAALASNPADEPIQHQPVPKTASLSSLQRSEHHYRLVLALIILVMLSCLTIFAIRLHMKN